MFVDARTVAPGTNVETGICIIGAGAAGITLARSLRSAHVPVVLLESGGLEFDAATQDLDAGLMTGLRNYPTDVSRLRYFWRNHESLGRDFAAIRGFRLSATAVHPA